MKKLLTYLLLLPIYFYRNCISPFTPPSCRFTPTCSQYAIEALKKHGPFKGMYLTIRRLLRCHPVPDYPQTPALSPMGRLGLRPCTLIQCTVT